MFILVLRLFVAILFALSLGKLISKIRLPSILGWLISGMILGPYALNVMNHPLLDASGYHIFLSIVEISAGLMIGAELIFSKLKQYGKQIMVTTFIQSMGTFFVVTLAFGLIFAFTGVPIYASFLLGGIALATAPTPALSIVKEFQTDGPVTQTLIPIAALDDIIAFIVFFTTIAIATSRFTQETVSLSVTLFLRILLPLLIGIANGIVAGIFLKKKTNHLQTLATTIFFILLASGAGLMVNYWLLEEPVLNFLLIGLAFSGTFANIVSEERMNHIMYVFNPILRLSLTVLILNLGAPLNYRLILNSGIFTVIYILARAVGKYGFASLGAKLTGLHPNVQKYLGLTLLPHSGTSLIFTGIAVTSLQAFDPETTLIIQGTISAVAVINEVFAVILSKKAFDWAGETGQVTVSKS